MQTTSVKTTDASCAMRYRSIRRRVWCDAELPAALIDTLCTGDMDRVLFAATPLQVKDRCIVGRYETGGRTFLVKRHTWGGFNRTLRMAFREPASTHCARIGTYLHNLGVRTPRPRGTVDFHIGPWNHCSYLLSDYVVGTPLYQCIRYGSQTDSELHHLARQVAQLWQQFVTLGVSHNDFKLENFIVDDDSRVWIIDFEKTRLSGRAERQQARQAADVLNFLHIRGWHRRPRARAFFAEAFLKAPSGSWLKNYGIDRVAGGLSLKDGECDAGLSAVILCDEPAELQRARQAIRSVRDIADEILLVRPTEQGDVELLKRIEPVTGRSSEVDRRNPHSNAVPVSRLVRFPWTLVLQQNESVAPFMAKELQQRICSGAEQVAYRTELKLEHFGRSVRFRRDQPIRLARLADCDLKLANGRIHIDGGEQTVGRLLGFVHVNESASITELVDRLNKQSSETAKARFRAGDRARLGRALVHSVLHCLKECLSASGIGSGWTGVQLALIRNIFRWLEEAKLYQLGSEFHAEHSNESVKTQESSAREDDGDQTSQSLARAA